MNQPCGARSRALTKTLAAGGGGLARLVRRARRRVRLDDAALEPLVTAVEDLACGAIDGRVVVVADATEQRVDLAPGAAAEDVGQFDRVRVRRLRANIALCAD